MKYLLCLLVLVSGVAFAQSLEPVNPSELLTGLPIIETATCELEGKQELSHIKGQFICAFFEVNDTTIYLGVFDTGSQELLYLLELQKNVEPYIWLIWQNENIPKRCTGECI